MNKAGLLGAVYACTLAMFNASANASIIAYTSESTFLSAAPIVSTEDFDDFTTPQMWDVNDILIDGVNYNTTECLSYHEVSCWSISSDYDSPPNGLISNNISLNTISFGVNNYVTAFGLWFSGSSGYGPDGSGLGPEWTITVTETNGDAFVVHEDILLPFVYAQLSRYYGFESDIGIREISFFDDPFVRAAGNWSFDNVSHSLIQSSVPIPPALYLFGSGLLGLIGIARRKKST